MARDLASLLNYEIKRKPEIASLAACVRDMSEAEIDALPVLHWIRRALKLHRSQQVGADTELAMAALMQGKVTRGATPDPMGEMRRWQAGDTWLSMGRGAIEIRPGHLLWLPETGGVWLDTAFSERLDPRIGSMTAWLGRVSKTDYKEAIRAERDRMAGPLTPELPLSRTVGGTPETISPLARYGVRFTR